MIGDTDLEALLDQSQQTPIRHTLLDQLQQLSVGNGRKVALKITFPDAPGMIIEGLLEGLRGPLGVSLGSLPVRTRVAISVKDGFEDQFHGRLRHPIFDRGDAQGACPTFGLRDVISRLHILSSPL